MYAGQITIWDDNPGRAVNIHGKLAAALQKMKIKAGISIQSEPPLIARQNLTGKTPTLEIAGAYWCKTPGKEPGETDLANLLHKVFVEMPGAM